jgi:hypothetical protein
MEIKLLSQLVSVSMVSDISVMVMSEYFNNDFVPEIFQQLEVSLVIF